MCLCIGFSMSVLFLKETTSDRRPYGLEDNLHSRAEKSRCISPVGVGGMNRDFEVGADAHALREAKAIKRLEYALVAFAGEIRLAVVEGSATHVSPAPERLNPWQAEPVDIFSGRSRGVHQSEPARMATRHGIIRDVTESRRHIHCHCSSYRLATCQCDRAGILHQ